MDSLRDIRRNIKSVKATQQIMYTMKMVASARIKRAQTSIINSRPFAVKMTRMLSTLRHELREDDGTFEGSHLRDVLESRSPREGKVLLLITSDKGLCGSFNASLFRQVTQWIVDNRSSKIYVYVVGRKGRDFIKRLRGADIEIVEELTGIFPNAGYVHAEMLGAHLLDFFLGRNVESVTAIYSEFKTVLSQKAVVAPFLPLLAAVDDCDVGDSQCMHLHDFTFEPCKRSLFEHLAPRYIKAQVYRMLLESQASELAARMTAMDTASKNALDLLSQLTLKLNRTRQSIITTELTEIVAGAEALKN